MKPTTCPACESGLNPREYLAMAADDHDISDEEFESLAMEVQAHHGKRGTG